MKAAFRSVLSLLLASLLFQDVFTHSPPQLVPDAGDSQRIIKPRMMATLPCPVSGDKSQMMFEWYKDRESLLPFGGHRLRVTGSGALRVKDAVLEDTGIYTCRAVNGFGSVEHNVTLVVLDGEDDEEEDEDKDYEYEDPSYSTDEDSFPEDRREELSTHKLSQSIMPSLLYVSEREKTSIHKFPGSSIELHCVAAGHPTPKVTWSKDGGEVPSTAKRGRWSLRLQNLQIYHSGNYTCKASNILGTASHSFYIEVSTTPDLNRGKPEMTGAHPSNTTVEEGQTATLQCVVRSVMPAHIEWLKRVEEDEMNEDFRDFIKVENEYFRVIKSSDVMNRPDGSYLNKMVIHVPTMRDSGKYICLGANSNGYSYRSAFLSVLPKPVISSGSDTLPFPIVVAVIVVGVAVIAGVVVSLLYCRSRQTRTSTSSGSTTAVPMVTKDVLTQRSRSSRSCGSVMYEPANHIRGQHSQHQVTLYVPQCHVNRIR